MGIARMHLLSVTGPGLWLHRSYLMVYVSKRAAMTCARPEPRMLATGVQASRKQKLVHPMCRALRASTFGRVPRVSR